MNTNKNGGAWMPKQKRRNSSQDGAQSAGSRSAGTLDHVGDGLIDGLRRQLMSFIRRKLPFESQQGEFAESVTAEAFDRLLEAVSKGTDITNPPRVAI